MKTINSILKVSDIKKEDCCGCSSCVNICPQKCIEMKPDEEGFLYPNIHNVDCTECGLCYESCPLVNNSGKISTDFKYKVFASKIKDEDIRSYSTSGGIFSALSRFIFEKGGIVCGVVYDRDFKKITHTFARNWDELSKMRRSKLVQSDKKLIFSDIKKHLEENTYVLFSGTPCEVAGLKNYLGKEYNNLFTCDLICGCVASPKVYKNYIEFLEKKYESKVINVNFKDKSLGWHNLKVSIDFENGKQYSNGIYDDPYVVSFHSRFNIRHSCFNCRFRGSNSWSDITLGDFWGINYIDPKLDDNKGLSFVLVNTHKGDYLNKRISIFVESNPINNLLIEEYSEKFNVCLCKSLINAPEENRRNFFNDLNNGMNFEKLFEIHLAKICNERKLKKIEYFKKLNNCNGKIS